MGRRAIAIVRRLGPAGPLAVVASTLPIIGLVTLAFCFNIIGPWLRAQDGTGVLIYTLGFMVCAGLAIFPTHILSALGGWTFGFALGCPAAIAGVLGAALLGYAIARRAAGDRAVRLIEEQPKWRAVYQALLGSGFWRSLLIVVLVRGALSPFALTNLVMAAARTHPLTYALGTAIGLAPRTAGVVFLAVGLHQITERTPEHRWLWITGAVLTVVAVVVIGHIANRAMARVTAAEPASQPTEER